jgi:hypothetical protein
VTFEREFISLIGLMATQEASLGDKVVYIKHVNIENRDTMHKYFENT